MKIVFMLLLALYSYSTDLIQTVKLHNDAIDKLILADGKIYTASFDGTIKRFNPSTGEVRLIGKIGDWVRALVVVNGLIISGDNQGYIRAWGNDGKLKWQIKAHEWWITDMVLFENKLVTVSMDEHVKMWNIETRKKLFDQKVDGSPKHQCVCLHKDTVFIGSTNTISSLIVTEPMAPITVFYTNGLPTVVTACESMENKIVFGLSDGRILVSDEKKSIEYFKVHQGAIKALAQQGQYLYAGSDDGSIKKINMNNPKKILTVYEGKSAVRTMIVKENLIFAGFEDGTLKVFKE